MENPASPKIKRDTLEGKSKDGEPLGNRENLLIPQTNDARSNYLAHYDNVNWKKEE